MKILNANQIREADMATIKSQDITSIQLMERVGGLCFNWIDTYLKSSQVHISIFCGVGNNGGDGLVIARKLIQQGYTVSCYVVNFSERKTEEFSHNYNLLKELGAEPLEINSEKDFPTISKDDFIIDAIFGIGLTRSILGFTADLIRLLNMSKAYILAIDIPSGLYLEKSNSKSDSVIKATHTITFQTPKLPFLIPENKIESWEVLDISLAEGFLKIVECDYQTIEAGFVSEILNQRKKFSHKGTYGHSLIMGGSYGKIGAVVLAAKSALKSGSGLVTSYIPKCGYEVHQVAIPEIMVEVDADTNLEFFNYKSNPNVIGIGPGMGTSEKTIKGFTKFLDENELPLVIDADAINIISRNRELILKIPRGSVLTPHPKELERLIGVWKNDFDKIEKAKEFSTNYNLILVVKGAHTMIVDRDKLYFNCTGNTALATAGSGDVLMGIITGLLAQNYTSVNATILGVYLHGLSADLGLKKESVETFTASNILDYLGMAFKSLREHEVLPQV
ncbi:MAG: NAD(P)H-hydrate dehydratase [Flavobacteriaceae bacterium]|nr:NAD(P)H-hydrate dehydratase [Flavobacteriaceae bacterium]